MIGLYLNIIGLVLLHLLLDYNAHRSCIVAFKSITPQLSLRESLLGGNMHEMDTCGMKSCRQTLEIDHCKRKLYQQCMHGDEPGALHNRLHISI